MKTILTELVFLLDKSGSMSGLEDDTIGGFNAFLKKQQAAPGACRITTVLFDNGHTLLHDRIDLHAVRPMTAREYCVGGSTALLDAVGMAIRKIDGVQKSTVAGGQTHKVLFVIITDGMENSSREYGAAQIKALIEQKKKQSGWEFIFLGANIDAVKTAGQYGIAPDRAVDYLADEQGTALNFKAVSAAAETFRAVGKVDGAFFAPIRADVEKRRRQQ